MSYSISVTCSNLTAGASNPTTIETSGTATLTFTANGTSYRAPSCISSIIGATAAFTRSSDTSCTVVLSNPTANVTLVIAGEAIYKLSQAGSTIQNDLNLLDNNGATNGQVLMANSGKATWTTLDTATTTADGLLSSADKTKLNGISAGATAVSVSETGTASGNPVSYITIDGDTRMLASSATEGTSIKSTGVTTSGLVLTANGSGGASWEAGSGSAGVSSIGGKTGVITIGSNLSFDGQQLNATDTTYSVATTSAAGLESAADKTKLDSLVTVSGTNDGTNWNTLTINNVTKNLGTATSSGVSSIGGKTGAITLGTGLSINDSKVLSFSGSIPTKTSDITNDSGFITNTTASISESQVSNLTTDLAAKAAATDVTALGTRVTTIEGKESGWDGKSTVSGSYDTSGNWTSITINGTQKTINSVATFG